MADTNLKRETSAEKFVPAVDQTENAAAESPEQSPDIIDPDGVLVSGAITGEKNENGRTYKIGVKGYGGAIPDTMKGKFIRDRLIPADEFGELVARFHLPKGLNHLEGWEEAEKEPETASELKYPAANEAPLKPETLPAYQQQSPEAAAIAPNNLASLNTQESGVPVSELTARVKKGIISGHNDAHELSKMAAQAHEQASSQG